MQKQFSILFYGFLAALVFLVSCQPKSKETKLKSRIVIAEKVDATSLNPVSVSDELSIYLSMQMFQTLTTVDFETNQLVGVLAESRPLIEIEEDGRQKITYQIRGEASFADGSKLTARDVAFSLKANVCPLVNNLGGVNYYGRYIDSIGFYEDSLRISFFCESIDIQNELVSGDFFVLKEKHYDPKGILNAFRYDELVKIDSLKEQKEIQFFAEEFNDQKFANNKDFIVGSGPYQLEKWERGQRIIIKKKENWWGDQFKEEHTFFRAKAKQLQYEIIPDQNTAIAALKSGKVDFLRKINAKNYAALSDSMLVKRSTDKFAYQFLNFNLEQSALSDLSVRKSIAYATPIEKIIEVVFQNEAEATHVPFSANQKNMINDTIQGYAYDLNKSKQLLAEANWKDEDGDGILEKEINGELVELKLSYLYNSGNDFRKSVGLVLKEELKEIGIALEVQGIEWSVYLQRQRNGDFDISYGGVINHPLLSDFYSIFHSKSANGGRNLANYKSDLADSLIGLINVELDVKKRKYLINRFQEVIHKDLPYLYLLSPKERIAHSKQLKNANIYALRPNFWAPELSW